MNLFRNSLAAVALVALAVLLIAPAAEASRSGLPAAYEPALEPPATPDQVLEAELSDPPERLRLFEDLRLPERPLELVEARKTASGPSTFGLRLNIRQTGGLGRNCSGLSFQGLWTDPVTGISYARNRWYDARTASWLSEDPLGAVDSPNLYAAFGLAPHLYSDPMGTDIAVTREARRRAAARRQPGQIDPDERGLAWALGWLKQGVETVITLPFMPMIIAGGIHDQAVEDARRVHEVQKEHGIQAANQEAKQIQIERQKELGVRVVSSLPVVSTVLGTEEAMELCEQDPGLACSEAWGRVTFMAQLDVTVVYGAAKATQPGRVVSRTPQSPPEVELSFRSHGDMAEFARQVAGQEAGINKLTAGQIKANIETFFAEGRPSSASAAIRAARRTNPQAAQGRAGLHDPDCCIGGPPENVTGFGGIPENSSLGAQNRWHVQTVYDAVKELPADSPVRFRFLIEPEPGSPNS